MTFDVTRFPPAGADATEELSDDELSVLALSADPNAPLPPDAVPVDQVLGPPPPSLLPEWYLGPATRVHASRWRRPVVIALIAAFLLIDAAGLCNTFGFLTWA